MYLVKRGKQTVVLTQKSVHRHHVILDRYATVSVYCIICSGDKANTALIEYCTCRNHDMALGEPSGKVSSANCLQIVVYICARPHWLNYTRLFYMLWKYSYMGITQGWVGDPLFRLVALILIIKSVNWDQTTNQLGKFLFSSIDAMCPTFWFVIFYETNSPQNW